MKIKEYAVAGMIFLAGACNPLYSDSDKGNKGPENSEKPATLEQISEEYTQKISKIFKNAQERLNKYERERMELSKRYMEYLQEENKMLERLEKSYKEQIKRIRDVRLFMPKVFEFQIQNKDIKKLLEAYNFYEEKYKILQKTDINSDKKISQEEANNYIRWLKSKNKGETELDFKRWYNQESLKVTSNPYLKTKQTKPKKQSKKQ